ncbi:MAG TPA: hypothetical protein VFE34_14660 [Dongiaceae bacterium]|jgi:hypothetical protein|nr:hypothetical protein [Dongiaceae bacterium]
MKPVTYDFDVITDAPAPQSRPPEIAEKALQEDPAEERKRAALPEDDPRIKSRAAE